MMWNESELSLVSGVRLNGKKDDKGDMKKERDGWRGVGERFVCFFTTLCGLVISWEEVRDGRAFLFFLFFSWILFFLVVSPNQLLHFSLSASPSHLLSLLFLSLSLVSALRWKFEIILTRPFCLDGKETTEPIVL